MGELSQHSMRLTCECRQIPAHIQQLPLGHARPTMLEGLEMQHLVPRLTLETKEIKLTVVQARSVTTFYCYTRPESFIGIFVI